MLKSTILLAFLVGACALDSDNLEQKSSLGETCCDKDCKEPCPEPEPGPQCIDNGVVVDLDSDPANVDNFDQRVTYCHATHSETNPFVVITTSIAACRAHEEHQDEEDIFPTGGCED